MASKINRQLSLMNVFHKAFFIKIGNYFSDAILKKQTLYFGIFLPVVYSFIAIFFTPVWGDELLYHIPTAKNFTFSVLFGDNLLYNTAYTPLPYIIGKTFINMWDSYILLRLINFLIFLCLLLVFYKIFILLNKKPLFFILLLISNPYLLRASTTYYMFNYGLLFAFIAFYFIIKNETKFSNTIVSLMLSLAVLSQQWMLILVVARQIVELVNNIKLKNGLNVYIKNLAVQVVLLSPALLIFFIWKGLTVPQFNIHQLKPTFEHANAVFANIGFIGIFIILFNFKRFLNINYLSLIFLIPLIWLTIPNHSNLHGLENSTGVAAQICTQLQKFVLIPYNFSMLILVFFGILVYVLVFINKSDKFSHILKLFIIGLSVVFTSSVKLGASHIYILVPFIFLYFRDEIDGNKYLKQSILIQMYFLALFYLIYYTNFITTNNSL